MLGFLKLISGNVRPYCHTNNITQINSTDEKQNQTIAEQQKIIEQLRNNNAEQQKLIENLEKRIEKLEKSK